MDGTHFDDMVRLLTKGGSRRGVMSLLVGVGFGGVASRLGRDGAEAKNNGGKKKKGKGKKHKKKKRDEPKGKPCGDGFCNQNQCCYLTHCIDKSLCCIRDNDCDACLRCENGLCVPDPTKEGKACKGCLECVNGACGIPNDEFCPDDHQCRSGSGECCATCINDKCCPSGSICINPGPFNENSCCDLSLNRACGNNGDGTFKECCNPRTEECVDGECVPKCELGLTAQELCCPQGQVPCGDDCCDGECCDGECVDTQTHPVHCGACGNACDERTETCFDGECRDICSLNEVYTVACDDGVDYWCCPERSPVCCRLSGAPHCC